MPKSRIEKLKRIARYFIPHKIYLWLSNRKNIIKLKRKRRMANLTSAPQEDIVNQYWTNVFETAKACRTQWWESELVRRHLNILTNNVDSPDLAEGLHRLLAKHLNGRRLKHGVSVGCGKGDKELQLLQLDIVEKFICFDLSEGAIKIAKESAKRLDLEDRIEFLVADAFTYNFENLTIDLVHWSGSLHHMIDVPFAVKWSHDILEQGGVFYMSYEYVGPNLFQFPIHVLNIANEILDELPHKYLKHPHADGQYMGRIVNVDPKVLHLQDPSEAADSEKILGSIKDFFPQAEIIPLGGIIWAVALTGLYHNFDESNAVDASALSHLLQIDKQYAQGENACMSLHASALAIK